MMRLSALADQAIVLMAAAARHCGQHRWSAGELAAEADIAPATAQKLVSMLSRAGLLRGIRGIGGGVQLARPAASITLADIVEAIEGPIAMTPCIDEAADPCTREGHCATRPHWGAINQAVRGALAAVPLTRFAEPAQ